MTKRVFVQVVGFTDVERHALNTVFRLSELRPTSYWLWTPEAPEPAHLALLDGQSYEARLAFESLSHEGPYLAWIGDDAPAGTWRSFSRPLAWPDVVQAMDEMFTPLTTVDFDVELDVDVDVDLDLDTGPATVPPEALAGDVPSRRALIASSDLSERLYLRAKLALHELTVADEAETAADVMELLRQNHYEVALIDFGLRGSDGWPFIRRLAQARSMISHLVVTKDSASPRERIKAWLAGVEAFLTKPADPLKLQRMLRKV
jgi:CheY-like chemotaxis protein